MSGTGRLLLHNLGSMECGVGSCFPCKNVKVGGKLPSRVNVNARRQVYRAQTCNVKDEQNYSLSLSVVLLLCAHTA